jgi:hypothetical protein
MMPTMNVPPMPLPRYLQATTRKRCEALIYGICRSTGVLKTVREPLPKDNGWCRSTALGRAKAKLIQPRIVSVEARQPEEAARQ